MAQYYTDQDRIDAQTMRIDNPNIVGSGYIQFPPQRPFEKPVQMQPPTVAHLEYPQEYQQYSGAAQPSQRPAPQSIPTPASQLPQANGSVRGPARPAAPQNHYSNAAPPRQATHQTQGAAPSNRQASARPPAPNYAAASQQPNGSRQQQARPPAAIQPASQQAASAAPHYHPQNAAPSQQRQAQPSANGYQIPMPSGAAPRNRQPVPAPRSTAALTSVAPATAAAASKAAEADDGEGAGLSAAQKKRLRKKMREGKA